MLSISRQGGSLDTFSGHDAIRGHSRRDFRYSGEEHWSRQHTLWAEGLRGVCGDRIGFSLAALFFTLLASSASDNFYSYIISFKAKNYNQWD